MVAVNASWLGNAKKTTDVWATTISGYDASSLYAVAINGKTVTAINQGDATATATTLAANWALSQEPEHREYFAASSGISVTFTQNTPGVPGTITKSVTGGAGTMASMSNSTVATGPNFWNNAANWSTGIVPVTGDSVTINGSLPGIFYGIDQTSTGSITLAAIFNDGGTQIGLPETNANAYTEYRQKDLQVGATIVRVNSSASVLYFDFGSVSTTFFLSATGSPPDGASRGACYFHGTSTSNIVNAVGGNLSIATDVSSTSAMATLNAGSKNSNSQVSITIGSATTITTATQESGVVLCYASPTTINVDGGNWISGRTAACTTASVRDSGRITFNATGTTTTLNVGPGGYADFSRMTGAVTITNTIQTYAKASIDDPYSRIGTTPIKFNQCREDDLDYLDIGINKTITMS